MRQLLVLAFLIAPTSLAAAEPVRISLTPCPGQGYIAYRYPAVGSCPCADESCFHPSRYYACCGDADQAYRKQFWKRWLKAHFCGASLLDGVPCRCVSPSVIAVAAPMATPPIDPPAPTEEPDNAGTSER